jgi:hypothetical protein
MWLPPDERRLLEGYAAKIGRPGADRWFRVGELARFLEHRRPSKVASTVPEYGETGSDQTEANASLEKMKQELIKYIHQCSRIEVAHAALTQRKLLSVERHQQEQDVVGVTLTVAAYDQGLKYAHWFTRSGECFAEYRNHWLFLIIGFLGGMLGALLVEALKRLLKSP